LTLSNAAADRASVACGFALPMFLTFWRTDLLLNSWLMSFLTWSQKTFRLAFNSQVNGRIYAQSQQ
jgi:hypothetical protein